MLLGNPRELPTTVKLCLEEAESERIGPECWFDPGSVSLYDKRELGRDRFSPSRKSSSDRI